MSAYGQLLRRVRRRIAWERRNRAGLAVCDDELLPWLGFANAGMLHPGQHYLIDLAAAQLPTGDPAVEIGSFCGLSTNVITHLLARHGRQNALFSVDPFVFEGEQEALPGSAIPFDEYRALVVDQFERNVRFWSRGRLPHAYQLTSDEFFAAWEAREHLVDLFGRKVALGGPISFCFVDGAHAYEQARRDFEHADRFVVEGGLILFDDSDELGAFPEVQRVVREALASRRYELVAANPHHLLRKR